MNHSSLYPHKHQSSWGICPSDKQREFLLQGWALLSVCRHWLPCSSCMCCGNSPTIRNILFNLFSLGKVFALSSAPKMSLYRHSTSIFLRWPLVQVDPKMLSVAVSLLTAWKLRDLRFSRCCPYVDGFRWHSVTLQETCVLWLTC